MTTYSSRRGVVGCLMTAAFVLGAAQLAAAPIPKLYSTGVDDSGALLANSTRDPHYTLVESADETFLGPDMFTLNGGFPVPPWLAEGPSSRWIAPRPEQGIGNNEGRYVIRTKFDLTGFDPAKARIQGRWAVDNSGEDIVLNGVSLGIFNNAGFGGFTDFVIESGFIAGENTLDFVLVNAPSGINPTGLRVELRGTVEIPDEAPRILDQPVGATLLVGEALSLSVTADGTPPFTYQWKRNGQDIQGATAATYTVDIVAAGDEGEYTVEVKNAVGTQTSDAVRVNVFEPVPGLYPTGVDDTRTVLFDGTPDMHYRLTVNPDGEPMDPVTQDTTLFPISTSTWLGANATSAWIGPRLETSGAAGGDYTYEVVVNLTGLDPTTVFINGTWASDNEATLLLNGAPTGIRNTTGFGTLATFTLTNGFVSGTNRLQFVVNNAGLGYTGLRVDSLRGGARKQTVTVLPPRIVSQPSSGTFLIGEDITLRAVVDGTAPLTLQWLRNGEILTGRTEATLSLGAASVGLSGNYTLNVRNSAGETNSQAASVVVLERVAGVFSTGVDASGVALDDGIVDGHYQIVTNATDSASLDAIVHDSTIFPIVTGPWFANSATSKWIGPKLNTVDAAAGDHVYATSFDLTGFDPATAVLLGSWGTDNEGLDIRINGVSTGIRNTVQFANLTPFAVTTGFVAGVNKVEFVVNNSAAGYTALRVDNLRVGASRASAVAPGVVISTTETGVRLSWPRSATGYRLVQSAALGGAWSDVNAPVLEVGDQNVVNVGAGEGVLFFRLQK